MYITTEKLTSHLQLKTMIKWQQEADTSYRSDVQTTQVVLVICSERGKWLLKRLCVGYYVQQDRVYVIRVQFVCHSVCEQDCCKCNLPISLKVGVMIGSTDWKN